MGGVAGLVFVAMYAAHVVLQRPGPADGSAATVAAFYIGHRGVLLLSEVLNGIGLLVFMLFLAAFTSSLRQIGEQVGQSAVLVSGTVFVTLGMVSTAAETALVRVADTGERAAVVALFELQAVIPIVLSVTAFTFASAFVALRTRLLPRWLGLVGLVASGLFLVGSVLSIFGNAAGESSPFGPVLFLVWILLLCIGLLRASR